MVISKLIRKKYLLRTNLFVEHNKRSHIECSGHSFIWELSNRISILNFITIKGIFCSLWFFFFFCVTRIYVHNESTRCTFTIQLSTNSLLCTLHTTHTHIHTQNNFLCNLTLFFVLSSVQYIFSNTYDCLIDNKKKKKHVFFKKECY